MTLSRVFFSASPAMLALLCGCAFVGRSATAVPARGVAPANLATVQNAEDEVLMGLPPNSLSSHAAVAVVEQSSLCADVLLRTWQGAGPTWQVRAIADGRQQEAVNWTPAACGRRQCFAGPADVPHLDTDGFATAVRIRGGRLCVPMADTPVRELRLRVTQGMFHINFLWPVRQQLVSSR